MVMKIGILEPENFSQKVYQKLSLLAQLEVFEADMSIEEFLSDKEILFIRLAFKINASFLQYCQKLKVICSPTTGLTHIDMEAMSKYNVKLISLKNHTKKLTEIRATPEHTIGLLIALFRNYRTSILSTHNFHWDRYKCIGKEVFGSNIGIVGMGRVGRQVATYLNTFGANVFYYDKSNNLNSYEYNSTLLSNVEEITKKCEAIILCASYNFFDAPILDRKLLLGMKDKYIVSGSWIIEKTPILDEMYNKRYCG